MTDLMLQLLLPLPCSRMPPQCGAMEASDQRTSPQATSFSPGAAIQELVLELEQQRREQELELGLNTLRVGGREVSEGVSVGHSEGNTVSDGSSSGSLASLLSLWEGTQQHSSEEVTEWRGFTLYLAGYWKALEPGSEAKNIVRWQKC